MLLSASKLFLRYRIVSGDRLLYIGELLAAIQPSLCCSSLARSMARFITAIPVKSSLLCSRRRKKLIKILRRAIHSAMASCKSEALKLIFPLQLPASGQLPLHSHAMLYLTFKSPLIDLDTHQL